MTTLEQAKANRAKAHKALERAIADLSVATRILGQIEGKMLLSENPDAKGCL